MSISCSSYMLKQSGLATSKNLFRKAKRNYINAQALNLFLNDNPKIERRLGALPFDWLKNLSAEEIPVITRQIDEYFRQFSVEISNFKENVYGYLNFSLLEEPCKNLLQALIKTLKRDDISIRYAGHGAIKHCHKLDVGDYSYALSTYISPKKMEPRLGNYFNGLHGRGVEGQGIFVRYKRGSHGRTAKPFMSRVCDSSEDLGGYILSKFIRRNQPSKVKIGSWQTRRAYINDIDSHNVINGISIEAGGISNNLRYISNPQVKFDWLRFAQVLDNLPSKYTFLSCEEQNKIIEFLTKARENGIDICDKKFLQGNKLSDEQIKFAKKLIKRVKTLRKLRDEMIKKGTYERIKGLLVEDFYIMYPKKAYSKDMFAGTEYSLEVEGYNPVYIFNQQNFLISELGINPVSARPINVMTKSKNSFNSYFF